MTTFKTSPCKWEAKEERMVMNSRGQDSEGVFRIKTEVTQVEAGLGWRGLITGVWVMKTARL